MFFPECETTSFHTYANQQVNLYSNSVCLQVADRRTKDSGWNHHHLFSFRRSVQDYKIQMDMEIVTFGGKQGVKPLQNVHQ
jgi:hypothetical protein